MENDIVLVKDISSSIDALDKKIDDIGNDNIINHSTIKDIEEDIARINKKIKNIDNKNRKRISIKNIKIFGTLIRLVLPYVVVSGLLFGVFAIFGDIPFVRQQQLKIAERKIVMETKSDNSASKNSYKSYVVKDS